MGLSQEVRFKIGGDTTGLAASFRQSESLAQASGRKMEEAFQKASRVRQRLSPSEGRAADREFKAATDRVTAERNLAAFRKKQQFEEANTAGKIRIVTNELADLARRRASAESGSTKQLETQLAIEERMVSLRKLQRQQAAQNLAGMPSDGGDGRGGERTEMRRSGMIGFGQLAFRAIGGMIAGALERINNFNQSRVRVAQAQEESGAAGLTSLRQRFATIGGLRGQLRQGEASLKDLESQRALEQQRIEFLSGGGDAVRKRLPVGAEISGDVASEIVAAEARKAANLLDPTELTKSEEAVARLNGEIQSQHDTNKLTAREIERQKLLYDANLQAVNSINRARERGRANEVQMARIETTRLTGVQYAERAFGTPEAARQAGLEIERARGEEAAAEQRMAQRRREVNRDLTGQAAEGRTFRDGRTRPRSETERLAQRAQQFRQTARDRALTGAGGDVPMFMDAARRDEASVASRLGAATAGVQKQDVSDSSSIKAEISRSNELLQAIADSLKDVDIE